MWSYSYSPLHQHSLFIVFAAVVKKRAHMLQLGCSCHAMHNTYGGETTLQWPATNKDKQSRRVAHHVPASVACNFLAYSDSLHVFS